MSMFKNPPVKASTVITDINNNFVNQEQVNNINTIPDLTSTVSNIQSEVNTTKTDVSNIQGDLSSLSQTIGNVQNVIQVLTGDVVLNINLVNETISIVDGIVVLKYTPISNKLIYDMLMITQTLDNGDILVHTEIKGGFDIVDKQIDLGTTAYDGLDVNVSYVIEGDL